MPNILVVEDHPDVLEMMCLCLSKGGHNVLGALNLESAHNLLMSNNIDLLVMDYKLPDGVATDFLLRMGVRAPPIAILITGYNGVENQDLFDMVLCKPVSCTTICHTVLSVLNGV